MKNQTERIVNGWQVVLINQGTENYSTKILDECGEDITTFKGDLTDNDVLIFQQGFFQGKSIGIRIGKDLKEIEIKRAFELVNKLQNYGNPLIPQKESI